jgi:hypothetical protein
MSHWQKQQNECGCEGKTLRRKEKTRTKKVTKKQFTHKKGPQEKESNLPLANSSTAD